LHLNRKELDGRGVCREFTGESARCWGLGRRWNVEPLFQFENATFECPEPVDKDGHIAVDLVESFVGGFGESVEGL